MDMRVRWRRLDTFEAVIEDRGPYRDEAELYAQLAPLESDQTRVQPTGRRLVDAGPAGP